MHVVDLPAWAVERGRGLNAFATLDPARTALVNVDMQNVFVAEGQAGAEGHRLYPGMDVAAGDALVDKYRYGALSCPAGALARVLAARRAEMVVITGTLTNCCCESTAREANMAGYKVIVVSDASAAVTDAEHNAALLNLRINFADVKTVDEVISSARRLA